MTISRLCRRCCFFFRRNPQLFPCFLECALFPKKINNPFRFLTVFCGKVAIFIGCKTRTHILSTNINVFFFLLRFALLATIVLFVHQRFFFFLLRFALLNCSSCISNHSTTHTHTLLSRIGTSRPSSQQIRQHATRNTHPTLVEMLSAPISHTTQFTHFSVGLRNIKGHTLWKHEKTPWRAHPSTCAVIHLTETRKSGEVLYKFWISTNQLKNALSTLSACCILARV